MKKYTILSILFSPLSKRKIKQKTIKSIPGNSHFNVGLTTSTILGFFSLTNKPKATGRTDVKKI